MLKAVIVGFIALHFQEALSFVLLFTGAAFMWDLYAVGNNDFERLSGSDIAWWWGKWAIGVVVSVALRWWLHRLRKLTFLGALDVAVRQLVVTFLVFLALTWYNVTIEDPAESLIEPFAVGAVISWLLVWLVLFVLEIVDFYVSERVPTEFDWRSSINEEAAIIVALIIFIDLLAFLDGWIIALLLLGGMLLFVFGGWLIRVVARVPPSKQTLFY